MSRKWGEDMALLPSKDMVLEACSGSVPVPHPILLAAYELAGLHEVRVSADPILLAEIDGARAGLMHDIDRWVATEMPQPFGAANTHTETVGMVVDRLAQFSVSAYAVLAAGAPKCDAHYAWKRLTELSIAYSDLSFEINNRTRRMPDYSATEPGGTGGRRNGGGGDC
jgi:hypothetical protein